MNDLKSSLRFLILSLGVCAVAYPAVVWLFGQAAAPAKAEGSLIRDPHGEVIGSALIAQGFASARYVWPRPSAVGYNAAAAGGSNLSPANPAVAERARATLAALGATAARPAPPDLVTASGSGLDPHVTLAAARYQAARVAAARGVGRRRGRAADRRAGLRPRRRPRRRAAGQRPGAEPRPRPSGSPLPPGGRAPR